MKTPHIHAELIKAWADGAEIEWQSSAGKWMLDKDVNWSYPKGRYRIKPEPRPDVTTFDCVEFGACGAMFEDGQINLKLTWDGETGKLKSAEVL